MAETNAGRFVWCELSTTDPAAAREFYPRVTGWATKEFPGGPMEYTVWQNGDMGVGGLMELPQQLRSMGVPPHWLGYVYATDVDRTIARTKQLGGALVAGPEQVAGAGFWAVLHDPQGATFAALRPDGPDRAPAPPAIGEFSWHELATTDHEAAFAFYADLFGWERTGTFDMGPMGTYITFGLEGQSFGGMMRKTPEMPAPYWLHYVRVDNADAAGRRVADAGGKVIMGPIDVPGGDRVAIGLDPQGAAFAVHALAAAK